MHDSNAYSRKYQEKSDQELIKITQDDKYLTEAQLAAVDELERRGLVDDHMLDLRKKLEAELERIIVQRRNQQRYQTFLPRLIASIVDSLVLWPVAFLFDLFYGTELLLIVLLADFLKQVLPYTYSVLLHGKYGQTLGKMAMSIKVIDVSEQRSITINQALLRDIVPILITVTFYMIALISVDLNNLNPHDAEEIIGQLWPVIILGAISFLWAMLEIVSLLFNEKSRAVHDLIAGTVVVRQL